MYGATMKFNKTYTLWTSTNGAKDNHATTVTNCFYVSIILKLTFCLCYLFIFSPQCSLVSSSHGEIYTDNAN